MSVFLVLKTPVFVPYLLENIFSRRFFIMTNEQIRQLTIMRRDGAGYGRIAEALHVSINTVKSWCRRHHLPGEGASGSVCENCGRPITQVAGRKRKRFCSDKCRNAWWNSHLDLVKHRAPLRRQPWIRRHFTTRPYSRRRCTSPAGCSIRSSSRRRNIRPSSSG